jgi:hypothetical protein
MFGYSCAKLEKFVFQAEISIIEPFTEVMPVSSGL